jgi:hypothetical protein
VERHLHRSDPIRHFTAGQGAILVEHFGLDLGAMALISDPATEVPGRFPELRYGQLVEFAHAASPRVTAFA